jgi:pyruvate/oxaloacetate carboxyltransferase
VRYNIVLRDAIQSLMGTAVSAEQILGAYQNVHDVGAATIQTSGGTFFDIFAKKGRDEWVENDQLLSHFKDKGVHQTMLVRGDFMLGYTPLAFDVLKATVKEFALMGMNDFQNFHGMSDVRATAGVAEAVRQVREETGLDIRATAGIMVTNNPNNTLDEALRTAAIMKEQGHTGFYFKSASGCVDDQAFGQLVERFVREFGADELYNAHIHGTYGKSSRAYMSGIEAAILNGASIGIDVQTPAMANSAAHESIVTMDDLIRSHPNQVIASAASEINHDALVADFAAQAKLRFHYRDTEVRYTKALHAAMEGAQVPGGASATLRGIPEFEASMTSALTQKLNRKPSWEEIQIAVYEMQAIIAEDLAYPEQVTPYAKNTTMQAAYSCLFDLIGKGKDHVLIPDTKQYLAGELGRVPDNVNPDWQKKVFEGLGIDSVQGYVGAMDRPDQLPGVEKTLKQTGIANPSARQMISALMVETNAVDHVVSCARGENEPVQAPALPEYAKEADPEGYKNAIGKAKWGAEHMVAALGGIERLADLSQKAVHIKKMDDGVVKYPDCLAFKQEEHRAEIVAELQDFIATIPVKLNAAGIDSLHVRKKGTLEYGFKLQTLNTVLADVFDHRGEGLLDYIREVTRQPVHPSVDPAFEDELRGDFAADMSLRF